MHRFSTKQNDLRTHNLEQFLPEYITNFNQWWFKGKSDIYNVFYKIDLLYKYYDKSKIIININVTIK